MSQRSRGDQPEQDALAVSPSASCSILVGEATVSHWIAIVNQGSQGFRDPQRVQRFF